MKEDSLKNIKQQLDSLAIFRPLLSMSGIKELRDYLSNPSIYAYGEFVSVLYESGYFSLGKLITALCERSENIYVKSIGTSKDIPENLTLTLSLELEILQAVADITASDLKALLESDNALPEFAYDKVDIKGQYLHRTQNIGKYGYGVFSSNHMFCLGTNGEIIPVRYPDKIELFDLFDYETERKIVVDNTKALIAGKPAANILMMGDAGTGKSSTIKAVANHLYTEGIRLIQVRKEQLSLLPNLMDELGPSPLKFIIFIDDLSFLKNDDSFSALKGVLEGSVCVRPNNVVIYATSNRRHIVKERFSDRDGDDIHRNDTIQEIVSLSDRFGIHISFYKPDKKTYLHIVSELASRKGILMPTVELETKAEQAALRRGGRTARCAKQFVDEILVFSGETEVK